VRRRYEIIYVGSGAGVPGDSGGEFGGFSGVGTGGAGAGVKFIGLTYFLVTTLFHQRYHKQSFAGVLVYICLTQLPTTHLRTKHF